MRAPATGTADRDRGVLTIVLMMLTVVVLAGGALVVDGGRALAARRHATGTAEAAARHAVATHSLTALTDHDRLRTRAVDFARRAGVAPGDVEVSIVADAEGPTVVVTVTERTAAVFLGLGGVSTMTVRATGSARFVYST